MAIRRISPDGIFREYIDGKVQRWREALVYNLCAVGEQALNAARSTNSYKDQTGNLRSSLGYVVAIDGKVVQMSDFAPSEQKTENTPDKVTGQREGKAYARQLLEKYPKGIVLLVVAGMNYASYVSAKGYDVLDSAELLAGRLIPEMLKQLGIK